MMHDRHDRLINRQVLYFKPSYWWNAVKNVKEKKFSVQLFCHCSKVEVKLLGILGLMTTWFSIYMWSQSELISNPRVCEN